MKVFVSGYWNANLGDDLFLKVLSQRYPQHDFYIISGHQAFAVFNHLKNVHQVRIPFFIKLANRFSKNGMKWLKAFQVRQVSRFAAYCELGGSLFIMPRQGMDLQYQLRKRIIATGLPYYVIGSNFGPYYSSQQLNNYRQLFSKMTHITFRDNYSFSLFDDLANVSYAPDVVFNLDTTDIPQRNNYVLISVINPEGRVGAVAAQAYLANLIRLIKQDLAAGEQVVLMSFCAAEGDLKVAEQIKNQVNDPRVQIFNHTEINASLCKIAGAKQVIATRYHAMILSWLFAKPTFVFSYSAKIKNVVSDLFPEQPLIQLDELTAGQQVQPTFACPKSLEDIRTQARQQFAALDKKLSNRGNYE